MMKLEEFRKLRDLIYRRSGIFIDDKKYDSFVKKLEKVYQKHDIKSFRELFHMVRFKKSNELFQDILNAITVNETYFFREKYQFEALVEEVLPELDKKRPKDEVIRILCAPSSTGEEPYSIALTLLDEGKLVERRDFEIVGIDIDSSVIEKAKRGIFNKRSVQFVPEHLLKEYFIQLDENRFEIVDDLKDVIDFRVSNVMDRYALKRLGKFDVIFSRNMLIYFDEVSRRACAMNFYEILKPGGYIFLGHAENMSRIVSVFEAVKLKKAFAYRKEG